MVPSPLPTSNSLKQLRINSSVFACNYSKNLTRHPWKLSTFHRNRYHLCAQVMCPMFFLLGAKYSLTMIASFTAQVIFTYEFGVTWGTVCDQMLLRLFLWVVSTHVKAPVARTWRALRRRPSRFASCCRSQIINLHIYIYYIYNTGMSFL